MDDEDRPIQFDDEAAGVEIYLTPTAVWMDAAEMLFEPRPDLVRAHLPVRTRGRKLSKDKPGAPALPLNGFLKGIDMLWEIRESPEETELILVTAPSKQGVAPKSVRFIDPEGDSITRDFRNQEAIIQKLGRGQNEITFTRRDGSKLTIFARVKHLWCIEGKSEASGNCCSARLLLEECEKDIRSFCEDYLKKGMRYVLPDNGILSLAELDRVIAQAKTIGRDLPPSTNALIVGETGTGKELIARLIREMRAEALSERAIRYGTGLPGCPFRAYNCSLIGGDPNVQMSRLFGRAPGYLGPRDPGETGLFLEAAGYGPLRRGQVQPLKVAGDGVLFLDEIAEMPPETQAMLLRTLQDGSVEPLGLPSIEAHPKVVFATNKKDDISDPQKFRKELFYRINQNVLELPPLRHRRKIIPHLVYYFTGQFFERRPELLDCYPDTKDPVEWDHQALAALCAYSWPGNIRELANTVESTLLFAHASPKVELENLSPAIRTHYEQLLMAFTPAEYRLIDCIAALASELFTEAWVHIPAGLAGQKLEMAEEERKRIEKLWQDAIDSKLEHLRAFIKSLPHDKAHRDAAFPDKGARNILHSTEPSDAYGKKQNSCRDQVIEWLSEQNRQQAGANAPSKDAIQNRAKELLRAAISRVWPLALSNQAEKIIFRKAEYEIFRRFMGMTRRAFQE